MAVCIRLSSSWLMWTKKNRHASTSIGRSRTAMSSTTTASSSSSATLVSNTNNDGRGRGMMKCNNNISLLFHHQQQQQNHQHHQQQAMTTAAAATTVFSSSSSRINEEEKDQVKKKKKVIVNVHKKQQQQQPVLSGAVDTDRSGGGADDTRATANLAERLVKEQMGYMIQQNQKHTTCHQHHIVAFSGGVDSSVVAKLLQLSYTKMQKPMQDVNASISTTTPPMTTTTIQAVLGISSSLSQEQYELAQYVANDIIGIPFSTVQTFEGENPMYLANNGQACYACKSELYHVLSSIYHHSQRSNSTGTTAAATTTTSTTSAHENRNSSNSVSSSDNNNKNDKVIILYNGTNYDDWQDKTRVGLLAATEFDVQSPLRDLTKCRIRQLAKYWNLPNWNYASNPCLRSRLAMNVTATTFHLQRIGESERFVRKQLELSLAKKLPNDDDEASIIVLPTINLRVRQLAKNTACVEIDNEYLAWLENHVIANDPTTWHDFFVTKMQFAKFTMRPFRSGSVAAIAQQAQEDGLKQQLTGEES